MDIKLLHQISELGNSEDIVHNAKAKFEIISRTQWKQNSTTSLQMMKALRSRFPALVSHSIQKFWVEAVLGGSADRVTVLLECNADHEFLFNPQAETMPIHNPVLKTLEWTNATGSLRFKAEPESGPVIVIEKKSSLAWAAAQGNLLLCQILVKVGASPWQVGPNLLSPFLEACRGDSLHVAKYFLNLPPNEKQIGTHSIIHDLHSCY